MINKTDKNGAVLVIGGGIAGMQASLDLAEMGYYVHMVEKNPAIGGRMAQLDKVFPTNDCAMCIISPKLNDCGSHINIDILTNTEVVGIEGSVGNFKVKIKKKPRYIDADKCTACGDCAGVCPIDVSSEFNLGQDTRKVPFKSYAQAYPNSFSVTKEGVSPCVVTCPAHVNAHGYVSLAGQGRFQEALEVIMDVLPLPGTLGRICAHPCETECRRKQVEEPLAIKDIKRLVADNADLKLAAETFTKAEAREEKVAIIGAGPAGLTAAWHLGRQGIKSVIYEKSSVAGGALRLAIPDYRLSPTVLQAEVDTILEYSGSEIKFNQSLGEDFSIDDLFNQGFKAVFLAMGASAEIKLGIPGENLEKIISCGPFLKEVNLGGRPDLKGKKILVVGGGNVAMDVSRTALRLGAASVTAACREGRSIMPAWAWEVAEAEEEGVKVVTLRSPKEFKEVGDKVSVAMHKMVDNKNPRNFVIDEQEPLWIEEFDTVIFSVGQMASSQILKEVEGIVLGPGGRVQIDPITFETGRKNVFAGGDLNRGVSLAIDAVAAGKEVAKSILRLFNNEDLAANREQIAFTGLEDYQKPPINEAKKPRAKVRARNPKEAILDFEEFELGFDVEQGMAEANRCISCSTCCQCYRCVKACLPGALTLETHNQKTEYTYLDVGAVVVATGFDPFNPAESETYRYTQWENVITALEFERILSASGPYQGHMIRPNNHEEPKKIAWLQCVGSRDLNRCDNRYCSAVCCMFAIKQAVIAKEHANGDLDTTVFYMDIRTYGKDFEKYYERAQDAGVNFVRSRIHTLTPQVNGDVALEYITEEGERKVEIFDMVILSAGLTPGASMNQLANDLGIELNDSGFVETSTFNPVSSNRPGIYVCGAISEPKDIPTTVMEASAAAEAASNDIVEARFTKTKTYIYPDERDILGEVPRIGVFVCHCGINIASVVDVESVAEYASKLPFVEYATDTLFTCSQDTQGKIKEAIVEHNLNRLVVASCSPRTHEPMFRETLAQAGLNKYLFEMANIRDHNSWVHRKEPAKATVKAKDLVRAAVAKAALLEPMHQTQMGLVREALVVGAGAAGLNASLALAQQGYPVHLLEKTDVLGGQALNIFPLGDDVQSYMADLIKQVLENEKIKIYKNSRPHSSVGFLGNFETHINTPEGDVLIEHGVTIFAAGGQAHKPDSYLYGKHDNVLLSLELDALLAEDSVKITNAKNFVFIQCVESRDEKRPYCSKICCNHTVENALIIKERNPEANIFVLYRDVRTYGFKEENYLKARQLGVRFIRYEVDEKPEVVQGADGKLLITIRDRIIQHQIQIEADFLTLASGVNPNHLMDLVEIFKGQLTAEGFLLEAHMKLRPVDLATEGQYLAGLAHYPKPLSESITQAKAAAARAITVLSKPHIMVGGIVATVDEKKCAVCCTCVRACPVSVPKIVRNQEDIALKGHAFMEPAICQGCGVCVSECPSKAITLHFYTDAQIIAKVMALAEGSTEDSNVEGL